MFSPRGRFDSDGFEPQDLSGPNGDAAMLRRAAYRMRRIRERAGMVSMSPDDHTTLTYTSPDDHTMLTYIYTYIRVLINIPHTSICCCVLPSLVSTIYFIYGLLVSPFQPFVVRLCDALSISLSLSPSLYLPLSISLSLSPFPFILHSQDLARLFGSSTSAQFFKDALSDFG